MERPGLVARSCCLSAKIRLPVVFFWHYRSQDQVEQHGHPDSEESANHKSDAQDGRVYAQGITQTTTYASYYFIVDRTNEFHVFIQV